MVLLLIFILIIYNEGLYIIKMKINNFYIMNDFWNNISRYPRFFISSSIGLILIILTPFRNIFKIKKLRFFLIFGFLLFITLLYVILQKMVGL